MQKRILLMCALLVSVITLSGATNRSFHTTLEQWNPIGFTQATNGITQAQSGPQITNRLTAGSAILPTVATAAPSGALRDGSTNVITFTTAKEVGETVRLYMEYSGAAPTLSGATGTPESGKSVTYSLTSQSLTITGDVTYLSCSDNQLTALDVSQNTALTMLDCSENQLTTLDVSQNTALRGFDCFNNQIKGAEMTRLVNSLPDRTGILSGSFVVVREPGLEGNICLKSHVAIAKRKNWNTQKYDSDTEEYDAYEGEEAGPNVITFTTAKAVGEKITLYIKYSGAAPTLSGLNGTPKDGDWSTHTLTSQNVTITGDVTYFRCSKNQLTTLDVSRNTALKKLYCTNNQLTTLDVSQNTALTELDCTNNQLTALDVSQNIALLWLYCSGNQLTALDVSKNTALEILWCSNNQLKAFDVSQNTALETLFCHGNQIKGEEMTRLVNSLPDRTGKNAGTFIVVQEPAPEGNICLKSDVAIAKGKNWYTYKYNSDTNESIPYGGDEASHNVITFKTLKKIGETVNLQMNYTGDAPTLSGATGTPESGKWITYKLTSQTVTIRGDVTELNCNGIQLLYFNGNQLTTLDVSQNTALTGLDCSNNQLKALDLSKNTALEQLWCYNNQLTTLDVSQNTALTTLSCFNNQLTTLDVSKNTALTGLYCSENQLTALDVSKNTALTELYCFNNQLTTLDVSKNKALTELKCSNNQLTTLDVSKNTALEKLWCSNNQLTTLDVSKNTALTELDCFGNQIKGEEMTRLVNSLPNRMGMDAGEFTVVQEPSPEGNRCLKTDVAIAKSKNWNTQKYKSDTKKYFDYEGAEPIPYAVTLTKEGEGTLTATGATDLTAVPEGTELTIVATPAAGHELKALTANGTDILATKKFVVTDNMTVKATFTKKSYTVTFTPEGEGKLTATRNGEPFTSGSPAHEGDKIVITAQPAEGYQIDKWLIGKEEIEFTPYTGQTTFECTVGTADVLIKATFAKKTAADVVNGSSVRLYPNPASTYVNVKGAKADALVRLYDTNGSLRYEARTDADGTLQIDLSAYAEGTYLLLVANDAQRLLIQR